MGNFETLRSAGLLNENTQDLRDLEIVCKKYMAYCTSRSCQLAWVRANPRSRQARAREMNENLHVPKPDAPTRSRECCECGFTLVYKELKAYGINEHRTR